MQRIRKSKMLAGLLSLFMLLQVILMPVANAASTDDGQGDAQVIVKVERKDNDAKDDKKTRKLRLYKISERELSQDELKNQFDKFKGKSQAEVEKELTEKRTTVRSETNDTGFTSEVKSEEIAPESSEIETSIEEIDGKSYDYYEFKDLADGAYLLIETDESAKNHQYKLVCLTFNIGKGQNLNQELLPKVDEQKAKPLILHKFAASKDPKNPKEITLEGVVFNLLDSEGKEIKLKKTNEGEYEFENNEGETELITNKDGNISINNLPDGKYTFKEIKSVKNYVIDEKSKEKSVEYQRMNGAKVLVENRTPDDKSIRVTLNKVDGDNKEKTLEGVEFRLYVRSGDTLTPVGENEKGELAAFKNANKIFTTDKDGNIIIDNLPELAKSSKYVFIEEKSLEGYQITQDKIYEVGKDNTIVVGNYKRPVDIKLTKFDIDTKKPIDKVGFELYRIKTDKANDGTIKVGDQKVGVYGKNGTYEYEAGSEDSTQIFQLYTDAKGNISVTGLPAGDYYLKENEPQENYKSDENMGKKTDHLSHEKDKYSQSNKSLLPPPVTPPKKGDGKTGSFKFMKVDDSKEKNRLEGATFAVYKVDEKDKAEPYEVDGKRLTVKSGKNGEFKVENLPYGKYQLRETAAPAGYILDVSPIAFEITETSETSKTIMIINKKNPDKSLVPPTVTPPGTRTPNGSTTPPGTRTRVPSTVNPPKTYYVPQDKPGIPRGPLVKTGDIKIIVFVAIGLVMIIAGKSIVSKEEKIQLKSISAR